VTSLELCVTRTRVGNPTARLTPRISNLPVTEFAWQAKPLFDKGDHVILGAKAFVVLILLELVGDHQKSRCPGRAILPPIPYLFSVYRLGPARYLSSLFAVGPEGGGDYDSKLLD
jgi:hypothetical protein